MSKKSELEKREKANEEEETIDAREEIFNEKAKLLCEIKALRLLICQIENSFDPMAFKNICKRQINDVVKAERGNFSEPIDLEVELQNDLYAYAGLCCTKIDEEIVFAFQSFEKNLAANHHWIQLVKIDERWELRQWVMPMSIDIKAVIAKYSIDSAGTMKLFLRECKHLIDCYNHRENEFRELKAFSESLKSGRCSVDSNYGYTQITIRLARARCPSPAEGRNVLVYLVYRASEARPSKLVIDGDGESKLSDDETRNLRALFRSLRERDLRDAVEKILASEGNPFVRMEATAENSANDSAEIEEDEAENSLSRMLKTKIKPTKKRGKIAVDRDENDNEVNEDDDGRENDLSIDAVDGPNVQSSEEDARGSKKAKTRSPKKKISRKPKTSTKAPSKPKTTRGVKKNLPLKDRNDNESNTNPGVPNDKRVEPSKNENEIRSIIPEMFKPRTKESTKNSVKEKAAETPPQKLPGRNRKIASSAEKSAVDAENSAVNSVKQPRGQLTCSTPIVGRTLALSAVAEENISAIDRESTTVVKEIAAPNKDSNVAENRDASDSSESDGEDATRIENSHRELLKELRAVRETKVAPRKPAKRKAKSPAQGRKKSARK